VSVICERGKGEDDGIGNSSSRSLRYIYHTALILRQVDAWTSGELRGTHIPCRWRMLFVGCAEIRK
jgi:hypothetical protein